MKKKVKAKRQNLGRKVEVDVSGQIGDTKLTVFALSNGCNFAISASGKTKRQLKKYFKENNLKINFYFHFYVAGLALLLRPNLKKIDDAVIDLELYGQTSQVKDALMSKLRVIGVPKNFSVSFKSVGKESPAHTLAYKVYSGEKPPDRSVTLSDLIGVILKK